MYHLKHISYRFPCYWLQKSQSLMSTLTSDIQIPLRKQRGPTDILRALDRSVPRDPLNSSYMYRDDPYLLPVKRSDYRLFALSYESGRETAMWIHKEHANCFPKDLSEPRIKDFLPPIPYNDESQVSEEIFMEAIADTNITKALNIYQLLKGNVSNTAKQNFLELLCFCNSQENMFTTLPLQKWFIKKDVRLFWILNPLVNDLYDFLKTQDFATACKAHNTMICGFAKWKKVEETQMLYEYCKKTDTPLNVNTYNYLIELLLDTFQYTSDSKLENCLYDILECMNDNGVRPNVRTLNGALWIASVLKNTATAENIANHILIEFKRLNIKLSLASYHYIILIFSRAGDSTYNTFMDILNTIAEQSFTIQDPNDVKFFFTAINAAYRTYLNKEAGEKVLDILFTGDNYKFLCSAQNEFAFYTLYMKLMLKTSTMENFFEQYKKLMPNFYLLDHRMYKEVLNSIKLCSPKEISEYLPKFWTDIEKYKISNMELKLTAITIMASVVSKAQPAANAIFASAAKSVWKHIKDTIKLQKTSEFSTATVSDIALLLLRNNDLVEFNEVLNYTIENLISFIPLISEKQLNDLFELCISERYFTEALTTLKLCISIERPQAAEMVKILQTNEEHLDNHQRNELKCLMKNDVV